jgi:ubiquinone/menaquinone biosynthesis C-methylase UbiE
LQKWYDSKHYSSSHGQTGGVYLDYFGDEKQRLSESELRYRFDLKSELQPNARVLEIGCATGSLLRILKNHGHDVLGIDLSAAFALWGNKTNSLEIRIGDFMDQRFADGEFDAVILLGTISNLQNIDHQLREIHRILGPSGKIFFNIPFSDTMIAKIFGQNYWMFTPSIPYFMSRFGCNTLLKRMGFQIKYQKMDRQKPTLNKVIGHIKFDAVYRLLKWLNLDKVSLPFRTPIPAVTWVVAEKLKT